MLAPSSVVSLEGEKVVGKKVRRASWFFMWPKWGNSGGFPLLRLIHRLPIWTSKALWNLHGCFEISNEKLIHLVQAICRIKISAACFNFGFTKKNCLYSTFGVFMYQLTPFLTPKSHHNSEFDRENSTFKRQLLFAKGQSESPFYYKLRSVRL